MSGHPALEFWWGGFDPRQFQAPPAPAPLRRQVYQGARGVNRGPQDACGVSAFAVPPRLSLVAPRTSNRGLSQGLRVTTIGTLTVPETSSSGPEFPLSEHATMAEGDETGWSSRWRRHRDARAPRLGRGGEPEEAAKEPQGHPAGC